MTVGVADPLVIEILENEFPKRVSQVVFNKQIKALCKNGWNKWIGEWV